ncbi:class II fructose-bisphosphate aldolase [Pseudoramibacter faecis]|uniref:class II fructose-bisphosphate aldolase n=1 Tax=Pseudoramibacter faecis TaxID=3108534 RepID=UPI002E77CF46|nr:class II fructose-bisphosphate aldolase [Pseudoramibacter sp. HA2172]
MLVDLKMLVDEAARQHRAVGAFNTVNLESVRAVIDAAEKRGEPVILQHAELHETMAPLVIIGPIMLDAAKRARVPVCVHLDHGENPAYLKQALNLGFTSVMIDASAKSFEENVAITQKVVALAGQYGASVEAELGRVIRPASGGGSDNPAHLPPDAAYTDPEAAGKFAAATGIDALAIAFGTAHGVYTVKPVLDVGRVAAVREAVGLPLVMHGGSGVSPVDYRAAIQNGIAKVNYFTYMSLAGAAGVRSILQKKKEGIRFDEMAEAARLAMQADVERAMRLFAGE